MMKIVIYILVLCSLCVSCSPRNKFGKSKKEITTINNRRSLKKEQKEREKNMADYKAHEERQNSEVTRAQQKTDAEIDEAMEKGRKRHRDFQSKETRRRMKENAKESNKKRY